MYSNIEKLKSSFKLISAKENWPPIEQWRSTHFQRFSEKIYAKTEISISKRTIERVFSLMLKKKSNYTPRIDTLNAIAIYLDFKDWDDLLKNLNDKAKATSDIDTETKRFTYPKYIFYVTLFVIATIGGLLFFLNAKSTKQEYNIDLSKVRFEIKEDEIGVPGVVDVNYDISSMESDSISMRVSGQKKLIYLNKDSHKYRHNLKIPGYYTFYLLVNNKVVKSDSILCSSDNWEISAIDINNYYPIYFNEKGGLLNGFLTIKDEDLSVFNNVLKLNQFWSKFILFKSFELPLNNLEFEVRLKTNLKKQKSRCHDLAIRLYGKGGQLGSRFVSNGCSDKANIYVNKMKYNGWDLNLDKLETNISEWHVYKIKSNKDTVNFYLDDELLYHYPIDEPLNDLVGIIINTKGVGMIDYVKINSAVVNKNIDMFF